MPKLILKFEAAVIKEFPILSSSVTIGRESDNDIPIDHPAVSRHHCRIILQGDTYFVEDLNSTNGTLVNGKKVIKAGIHDQDTVSIAKHSLVLVDDRTAAAAAPPPAPAPAAPQPVPAPAPAAPGDSQDVAAKVAEIKKNAGPLGGLRVMEGGVDQMDYALSENSTYIGKSERVAVKIKGMFAPEVAAMIGRKQNGYVLVAIKDGYPKVNGAAVQGERVLNEGDLIEVGGTKLQFYLKTT